MVLVALVGAGAIAQVATSTSPPTFRPSIGGSYATLDDAEAAIRSNTAYFGAEGQLEHVDTTQHGPDLLRLKYQIKPRLPERYYSPMYELISAVAGNGNPGCSVPVDDPTYAGQAYCGSESQLIAYAERKFAEAWPNCTISTTVQDHGAPRAEDGLLSNVVRYTSAKNFQTHAECQQSGTYHNHSWQIVKRVPFYCAAGYKSNGAYAIVGEAYGSMSLCAPRNTDLTTIDTTIQQCGSCAGSRNPIYPATGEKQRHEDDFAFAGRSFTRHYRSLRQFRNNPNFAVAWNHTWSDKVFATANAAAPYAHIDDEGNYESYAPLGGNLYRGENSVDRVLERVNANGVSLRLRLPSGEVREFNTNGRLIAVRHPSDPLGDLVLAYVDSVLATVTDAQGRVLRFEYEGGLLRRIVQPDGAVVSYGYDADRNLISVTYPDNAIRRYHYNETGLAGAANQRHQLTGITAEDNRRFASFGYDARGRAVSSRVLGTPNELTTISYPTEDSAAMNTAEGGTRAYVIEPGTYRRILSSEEGAGTVQRTYDAQGRLESLTDKRGIRTEYGYGGAYRTSVISALGTSEERREEFVHDPVSGEVIELRTRDRAGTLVARTLRTYNARLQPVTVSQVDPGTGATRTTTTTYCEVDDITAGRCPLVGLVLSVDGPVAGTGDIVRHEYRMADEPSCVLLPATCPWRKGDLWRTTNAAGHVVEYLRYDGAGRALSTRDANGVVTDVEYDLRGRIVASKIWGVNDASEVDDRIARIEYDPTGSTHRVVSPDGSYTRFEYDAAQRLTAIIDAAGNRVNYTLNAAGERIGEETIDPAGALRRALTRTYDTLGRLQSQVDADQRAIVHAYDAGDNLALTTDALNRKTGHDYDALGRLRSTLQDVEGVAALTQFQYDALDRITRVTDPNGKPTAYAYNGFGDLVQQQSPDTGQTSFTHNGAGNVQTRTDARGITATHAYDGLQRLTSVVYPDSSRNVGFAYDAAVDDCLSGERFAKGRVSLMTDASGSTAYCYDRYGNVVRKLQVTQGRTFVLRYLHTDPRGRLPGQDSLLQNPPPGNQMIGMTYPDGSTVRIVRDSQMRPVELRVTQANGTAQVLLHTGRYSPFGPITGWTFGNGRLLTRSYDLNYRPQSIQDSGAGGIDLGYRFDAAGNLASLHTASRTEPARRRYAYDGMHRLTQVRDGAGNELLQAYGYDATGNRTQRTDGATARNYTYAVGKHWLADVGGVTRDYDAAGNTLRIGGGVSGSPPPGGCTGCETENPGDPGPGPILPPPGETEGMATTQSATADAPIVREFEYDDANRMRAVKHDGVVAMSYLYNGKGERVYRYGGGTSVTTLHDEGGKWIGDYDANGQPIQQVIWLDNLPVGLLVGAGAGQKLYYLEADALGTPRVVIDPARNLAVWRWDLAGEVFGDSLPEQDADGDGTTFVLDMRFPGQRYDSATGLVYNYFRDYDPSTGRYVESDPIGLNGGVTTYAYAGADPLGSYDPLGLEWLKYNGKELVLYAGEYGHLTKVLRRCKSSSGKYAQSINYDYRTSSAQHVQNWGPTPEGRYTVNLRPDPNRVARVVRGQLSPSPQAGIEKIPAGGEQVWGTWRARLEPAAGTNTYGRHSMYLHDSKKGQTSGCIETCTELLQDLLRLRRAGVVRIEVSVEYDGTISTNGWR